MSTESSMAIIEQEIPGVGKEMHKEEAYSRYGDSERSVGIRAPEANGALAWILHRGTPKVDVCRREICVRSVTQDLKSRATRKRNLIDEERRSGASCRVGGF